MALLPPASPPPLFVDSSPSVASLLVRLPSQQDEHMQKVQSVDREESLQTALQILQKEGAVILQGCVSPDSLAECRLAVEPVVNALLFAAATAAAAAAATAAATTTAAVVSTTINDLICATEKAQLGDESIRTGPKPEDDKGQENQHLFSCFDETKVLSAEARRALGITRIAKIGTGKKNVHFEPYYSAARSAPLQPQRQAAAAGAPPPLSLPPPPPSSSSSSSSSSSCSSFCPSMTSLHPHSAMEALAETAGIASIIRSYCGEEVTLAESGFSVTRPGGEGLEWHADGREGECTVIMSLDDIEGGKGRLGVVRKSHLMLDRDGSEDFDQDLLEVVERAQAAEAEEGEEGGMVWYAYRTGCPIVFDARTVHAAEGSNGKGTGGGGKGGKEGGREGWREFRVILWWIYNGHG